MKIIMVFVVTLDGKTTRWGYPIVRSWTSKEDQLYFSELMQSSRLTVVGSSTFRADPIKTHIGRLLVVMTKYPEKYREQEIPGQLTFTDKNPTELAAFFTHEGYDQMLMVGGPHLATSFLKEKLIDEIWLTIEPRIFGSGGNFVVNQKLDINLRLINMERINAQGTIVNKYEVLKSAD